MEAVSVQPLLCSVVALGAAGLHGYTYWLRRKEPAHLWLAVSALGIVGIAVTTAMTYQASDGVSAERWQRFMVASAAIVLLGFHAFTECMLRLPRLPGAPFVYAVGAAMVGQLFWPDLVFGGAVVERSVGWIGLHYTARDMSPVGAGFVAGLFFVFAYLSRLWITHRAQIRDHHRILVFAIGFLFLTGIHDMLVGVRAFEAPMLIVFGYTGFLVSFSAILLDRLVRSMDEAELSAERLHELVETRTEELRLKDMQLAHGHQMATIGTLAASVAHEINNPIAFVQANLNQLEELWEKPEGEGDVFEILMECRDGVGRVRAIVADLLSMARRSDGKDELVDLREVVEGALPLLRREARSRAQLVTDLDEIPLVKGDPRLLGQIVLNLVVNALHAIPEGDAEGQRVKIATRDCEGSVELVVEDTGSGIPEDILPRIYDPFFTTKEKGQGTGLGLAVTLQLVTRHRGRIHVKTSSGGTRMTVEIPEADSL
jgi:signal transduction histidine kinase